MPGRVHRVNGKLVSCSSKVPPVQRKYPPARPEQEKKKCVSRCQQRDPASPMGGPEVLYLIDWWLWYRPPANSMIPGVNTMFPIGDDNRTRRTVPVVTYTLIVLN